MYCIKVLASDALPVCLGCGGGGKNGKVPRGIVLLAFFWIFGEFSLNKQN